jgi:hypothetical protein
MEYCVDVENMTYVDVLCYDLLFMCQLYDGSWVFWNDGIIRQIPLGGTPENEFPDGFSIVSEERFDMLPVYIGHISLYYDSDTYYFIVTEL